MMQCHRRQSYTRLGVWYVQDVSLYLWAFLVGTLAFLGCRHTNGSTRFGCTFYIITAQPVVWLDALCLSVICMKRGLNVFSNCFENLIFHLFFLAVGHLWDEEVLSSSWHLDLSGTLHWWVAFDSHINNVFLWHTKHSTVALLST